MVGDNKVEQIGVTVQRSGDCDIAFITPTSTVVTPSSFSLDVVGFVREIDSS